MFHQFAVAMSENLLAFGGKGNSRAYPIFVVLVCFAPKVTYADVGRGVVVLVLALVIALLAKATVAQEEFVEHVALRQSGF